MTKPRSIAAAAAPGLIKCLLLQLGPTIGADQDARTRTSRNKTPAGPDSGRTNLGQVIHFVIATCSPALAGTRAIMVSGAPRPSGPGRHFKDSRRANLIAATPLVNSALWTGSGSHRALLPYLAAGTVLLGVCGPAQRAKADGYGAGATVRLAQAGSGLPLPAADYADGTMVQLAQAGSASPLPTAVGPPTAGQTTPQNFSRFDPLRIKGINIPLPGPADTIDGEALGFRDKLASLGIGYFGFSTSFFADNTLRHGHPLNNQRGNQLYNGQLATSFSQNVLDVTFDLSRYGIPDGQIVAGGVYSTTNWNPAGPRTTGVTQLTYYQTLLNKKIELSVGYQQNSLQYLGTFVGGSIAGGIFGPNGTVPIENGIDNSIVPTLGVNAKFYLPSNFYTKLGVQRAISPDGTIVEHNQNASGVRLKVPNSGILVIDETGYQTNASPGVLRTWVRAAANYTSSNYREYNTTMGLTNRRGEGEYGV